MKLWSISFYPIPNWIRCNTIHEEQTALNVTDPWSECGSTRNKSTKWFPIGDHYNLSPHWTKTAVYFWLLFILGLSIALKISLSGKIYIGYAPISQVISHRSDLPPKNAWFTLLIHGMNAFSQYVFLRHHLNHIRQPGLRVRTDWCSTFHKCYEQ